MGRAPARLLRVESITVLCGTILLVAGAIGSHPGGARAQDAETTSSETTQVADSTLQPPCSEPTPCPAPDSIQDPEVTCYEPHSASASEAFTLHIYGRHLANADDPPKRVIYRNREDSGTGGYTNDEVEVKSTCHVVTTFNVVPNIGLRAGTTLEFRLLRDAAPLEKRRQGAVGKASGWFDLALTE